MNEVLTKRNNEVFSREATKGLRPSITKPISYARNQRDILDMAEKLMKYKNCGFSTIHKQLLLEKYQQIFGDKYLTPFF